MPTPPTDHPFGPSRADRRTLATLAEAGNRQRLEEALIRSHLRAGNHTKIKNVELASIASDTTSCAVELDIAVTSIDVTSIDALVAALEALVPAPDGGRNRDAVFTPQWVADMIAAETIVHDRRDGTVVDPSCGCGALLVAAFRRIWDLHPRSDRSPRLAQRIVSEQLHGMDLDADSVRRAGLLLAIAALHAGGDSETFDTSNLVRGDSLTSGAWGDKRFDVVVGNPPYVRYQQLSVTQRAEYRKRFRTLTSGNFNLYVAFFELASMLRAEGGTVGYIAPNAWLRATSTSALRSWMLENMPPTRIVDFGAAQVFDTVSTYTALVFADDREDQTSVLFAEGSNGATPRQSMPPQNHFVKVPFTDLGAGPWTLNGPATSSRLAAVKSVGRPLLELADIRYGAATLRDRLFLLDGSQQEGPETFSVFYQGNRFEVERAATVRAVKVPEVGSSAQLAGHPARIVFPYDHDPCTGRAVIWSRTKLGEHPGAAAYLEAVRPELSRRDKGKKRYADWFAYGRTQGISTYSSPRLLTPLYAAAPRFMVDNSDEFTVFLNGCSVTPRPDSGLSVELLEAVLNSAVLQWFITVTSAPLSGGYYSYQKGPLGSFTVADGVIERADEVVAAHVGDRDSLIADIYGLDVSACGRTGHAP